MHKVFHHIYEEMYPSIYLKCFLFKKQTPQLAWGKSQLLWGSVTSTVKKRVSNRWCLRSASSKHVSDLKLLTNEGGAL